MAEEVTGALRVLHVESASAGRQGDSMYRTRQPCDALGALPGVHVSSGTLLSPRVQRAAWNCPVLVLCDIVDVDALAVTAWRSARGLPTLYEVNDDFRDAPGGSPSGYLSRNLLMRALSPALARAATGLQFTTPELERRYGHLNGSRRVLPNQLARLPAPRPARGGDVVSIGWGGSRGHLEDVRDVLPVLARVLSRHPRVHLSLMGAEPFAHLAALLPPGRCTYRSAGDLEAYYEFLGGLDVGLAPNLPTRFNTGRSDVKVLEYGAHGVVPVVADVPPYRAAVTSWRDGVVYGSHRALEEALERLVQDEGLRASLALAARQGCEDRLESRAAPGRLAWLLEACELAGGKVEAPRGAPGGHVREEAPQALEAGLSALTTGDTEQALALLRTAASRQPDNTVAWLALGQASPRDEEARDALAAARRLEPRSAAACFLLGERLLPGDPAAGEQLLLEAERLAPGLGGGLFRLAQARLAAGDVRSAVELLGRATAASPAFVAPAVLRAQVALAAGQLDEARAAVEAALHEDDQAWHLHLLEGELGLRTGQPGAARDSLLRALELHGEPRAVLPALARAFAALGQLTQARALLQELTGPPARETARAAASDAASSP